VDGKSRGEGRRAGVGGCRGGTSHVRRNVGGSGRVEASGGRSGVVDRHVACEVGKIIVSRWFSSIVCLG
jgi:hypothetical protein